MGVEVTGVQKAVDNLWKASRLLEGEPMEAAMRACTLKVMREARQIVHVDTGRLRASIMPEVRSSGNVIEGVVGSNVEYAPYLELGTKRMQAYPYLQPAFDNNVAWIENEIGAAVSRIVVEANE